MRTCPFLSEEAVEGGAPPGASAEGVLSDGGFACEAILLQDFLGWGVLGVGFRLDPYDVVVEEEVVNDEGDGFGGVALPPLIWVYEELDLLVAVFEAVGEEAHAWPVLVYEPPMFIFESVVGLLQSPLCCGCEVFVFSDEFGVVQHALEVHDFLLCD